MWRGDSYGKLGVLIIVLTLVFCFAVAVECAAEGQIVLGVCEPLSGTMKDVGDRYLETLKYSADVINAKGGVLGKKLVVVSEDSQLKADVASRKATKLILEDKADFIMTGTGTHVFNAMVKVAEQYKRIAISYGTEASSTTGADFTPYIFRVCMNTDQHSGAVMDYFAKHTKFKKYYIVCQDYAFGREAAEGFEKGIKKISGAQLLGKEFHPIGLKDFAPYISKAMASGAEVVLTGNYGPDLDNLIKTGASLGWKCITGNYFLNDPIRMQQIGQAGVGHVTADSYIVTLDTPMNKEFVKAWHEKYKDRGIEFEYPELAFPRAYWGIQWLAEVIKKAGSTDSDKVIAAWEGMEYEMPSGKVTMRACDHQMITPGIAAVVQAKSELYSFPYFGKPIIIPPEDITVPPADTGNPRCK